MNLHPEFIAYWNNKGFKIKSETVEHVTIWYSTKTIDKPFFFIASYNIKRNTCILYNLPTKSGLTESEMLKYIRLLAFI